MKYLFRWITVTSDPTPLQQPRTEDVAMTSPELDILQAELICFRDQPGVTVPLSAAFALGGG